MRLCVDVEGQTEVGLGCCEDGFAAREAGVVDQDGRISQMCLDVLCGAFDSRGRGEVAVEVVHVGRSWRRLAFLIQGEGESRVRTDIFRLLDIQVRNLDPSLGEQLHDDSANTIAAAGHDDNLSLPIIHIVGPVVRCSTVQEAAHFVPETEVQRNFQPFPELRMFGNIFAATLGMESGDVEGDCVDGIESRVLKQSENSVEGEAWEHVLAGINKKKELNAPSRPSRHSLRIGIVPRFLNGKGWWREED